jgi:Relaxase/Mobilisation nuclease domain.
MGNLINIGGRYANVDAVENLIRYVTRTRPNEQRRDELYGYGGAGVFRYDTPEIMAARFNAVQDAYEISRRKGRRMVHEVFSVADREFGGLNCDMGLLNQIALELCRVYYSQGFQAVYAIHWDKEKKMHIHFAVNAVSFVTGKKFCTSVRGNRDRGRSFNTKLYQYCKMLHPEIGWEWNQPEEYEYGYTSVSIRIGAIQQPENRIRKAVYFKDRETVPLLKES